MTVLQFTIFDQEMYGQASQSSTTPKTIVPVAKNNGKLEDFGKKIGGARKDLFNKKIGILASDLEGMNTLEKQKYVNKNNVWPRPDYKSLLEGHDKLAVYFIKCMRDACPSAPENISQAHPYVLLLSMLKDQADKIITIEDCYGMRSILEDTGYIILRNNTLSYTQKAGGLTFFKLANFLYKATPNGLSYLEYKMKRAKFMDDSKKATSKTISKKKFRYEELKELRAEGYSYRNGNVRPDDFIDELGFRAGEFGNWVNQSERTESMNRCYDSIRNMAVALGVDAKAIASPRGNSDEALAIAFGSRGIANALAHFEPLRNVINLTRLQGAGSLAHELGHYLDRCMAIKYGGTELLYTNSFHQIPEMTNILKVMKEVTYTGENAVKCYQKELKERARTLEKRVYSSILYPCVHHNAIDSSELKKLIHAYVEALVNGTDYNGLAEIKRQCPISAIYIDDNRNWFKYYEQSIITLRNSINRGNVVPITVDTKFYSDAKKFDKNFMKDGDYWESDCELFARAFACYIKDKLESMGIVDDFLTGHADTDGSNIDGDVCYAHPIGKERKVINKAFDKLVNALKKNNFF